MKNRAKFRCPTCEAEYLVMRIEAEPSAKEYPLTCLSCGTPLHNREGKFAPRYFSIDGRPVVRGHKPLL